MPAERYAEQAVLVYSKLGRPRCAAAPSCRAAQSSPGCQASKAAARLVVALTVAFGFDCCASQVTRILTQLCAANRTVGGGTVVVLTQQARGGGGGSGGGGC